MYLTITIYKCYYINCFKGELVNMEYLEKINKIIEDEEFDIALVDVERAIDGKDKLEIEDIIDEMIENIKDMIKDANRDKIGYVIMKYLSKLQNKIGAYSPMLRAEFYQVLYERINEGLDCIKFEKQTLVELKRYLINCKENRYYDDLMVAFHVLVGLLGMRSERIEQLDIDIDVCQCGSKGIDYIPNNEPCSQEDNSKVIVEEKMSLLRKK